MATDFEKVEAETKTSENVTLDSEAQQSREAGKQLAEEGGGNSDLLAVARSMEQAARKQKNLTIELRQTTKAVADALKEIEAIHSSLHDIRPSSDWMRCRRRTSSTSMLSRRSPSAASSG